jgi:hypothetical protein
MIRDEPDRVVEYLVAELRRVMDAGATIVAAICIFSFIDAMAWANIGKGNVTGRDFAAWVDAYLVDDEPHEYKYSGAEIYKARCALLHQFAPNEQHSKTFGYVDVGPHRYRPEIRADVVFLSVEQLADDLWKGVARFLSDARGRPDWSLIERRFASMYEGTPLQPPK